MTTFFCIYCGHRADLEGGRESNDSSTSLSLSHGGDNEVPMNDEAFLHCPSCGQGRKYVREAEVTV